MTPRTPTHHRPAAGRLDATGRSLRVTNEFVTDLYERLPDDVVRPYVAAVDGEFHGDILTLESHGTVYAWQGGAKTDGDLDLNDYLDWTIIRDAVERGNHRYDLVGAESQRLCWYKAKFGPGLEPYHVVSWSSPGFDTLASSTSGSGRRLRSVRPRNRTRSARTYLVNGTERTCNP